MQYLKEKQYYVDLYDRHTVEKCRDLIRLHSQPMKNPPLYKGKKPSKKMMETLLKATLHWSLMFEKGNRYTEKEETITGWIARDQARDEFYESAEAPGDIACLTCRSPLKVTYKDLWTGGLDEPDRVLFMYDCPNGCLPRRAFYDNGEEWKSKPNPCPECGNRLVAEDKIIKEKLITKDMCTSCNFSKTDELERTVDKEEVSDPNLETDRIRFCLSEEEGNKWREELVRMEGMKKLVDEWKEKDKNKELYDAVAKIRKLTIVDLEKLLAPVLQKAEYVKLQLASPEIGRDVIIPFTAYDSEKDRVSRASEYNLKQLIKKTLQDTNWRLMSDGVSYRLGILSGRFRGYEREDDLLKLVNQ